MSATDRIRHLAKRATRPPWWTNEGAPFTILGEGDDGRQYEVGSPHGCGDARIDAQLIALLGTHAEALCDLADAARRLDVIEMGEHGVAVVGIDEVRDALARLDAEDGS